MARIPSIFAALAVLFGLSSTACSGGDDGGSSSGESTENGGGGGGALGAAGGPGGPGGPGNGCCTGCYCRGSDPTPESATAPGPYAVENYTSGYRDGPGFGAATIYYPTGDAAPPFAGVVVCPGWT